MPKDLRDNYDEFKHNCSIMVGDNKLIISTMLYVKLIQICAGFIIDTRESIIQNETVLYRLSPFKAEYITQMASDLDDTCIIWGTFREELKMLHENIRGSQLIMGGMKGGEEIINDFKAGKFKYLVANPACIGAGVSLEVAHYQIAASVSPSCCQYIQSVARTNRVNQKFEVVRYEVVYHGTIEEKIFTKISSKSTSQQKFLEEIIAQEFTNEKKI
jgi:hypothetical protein